MNSSTKLEIKTLVQKILDLNHLEYEKKRIDEGSNYLRFACPRCGDSTNNKRKKRGNLFFNSGFYHCYNCDWHTNILNFFKNFNEEINDVNIRINIRKTVNSYIELGITRNSNTISQDKIDILKNIAISKTELMNKLGLKPVFNTHTYIKQKNLKYRLNDMAFKKGNIYFFNMIDEDKLLGFQIRTFNPLYESQMKYLKYPIGKIYDKFFKSKKPKNVNFEQLNKISLLYNLLNVDFNKNITVFEGPSDSWLYPNSIGKSSVGLSDEFLDEIQHIRYFYDNDKAGNKKMSEKLKNGKQVFMWKKFLDENNLWDYNLKDWGDIIQISVKHKKPYFKIAEKYFSNKQLDLIYV